MNPSFVPVPGEVRQGLLFADARTPAQAAVLAAADGTRSLAAIARQCSLPREECERILAGLLADGDLRPATAQELGEGAERLRAAGRLEGAAQLLQYLVEIGGGEAAQERLAELLVLSSRRKDASGVYSVLAQRYAKGGRLGDALTAARKAAALLPGNWQLQNALCELAVLTGRRDEAARVWRAYARRLANVGNYEQALGIIDTAQKQLAGNDILLYAEAEILSLLERARQEPGSAELSAGPLSEQAKAFLHPAATPEEATVQPAPAEPAEKEGGTAAPIVPTVQGDQSESPMRAANEQPAVVGDVAYSDIAPGGIGAMGSAAPKESCEPVGAPEVLHVNTASSNGQHAFAPEGVPTEVDDASVRQEAVSFSASTEGTAQKLVRAASAEEIERTVYDPASSAQQLSRSSRLQGEASISEPGAIAAAADGGWTQGSDDSHLAAGRAFAAGDGMQPGASFQAHAGYLYADDDEENPVVEPVVCRAPAVRRRGWRLGTAAYLLGGIVALSIAAAGYDYQARESMRRAVEQSEWRLSASAQEPLNRKLGMAEQAEKELLQDKPYWDFLQTPAFLEQRKRVRLFVQKVERELQQLRQRQETVVADWKREPSEKNLAALRELAEDRDITSAPVLQARELYREWLQKQSQRPDALGLLLSALRDRNRPAAERYDAYNALVMDHPYAFLRDYDPAHPDAPQGCRNLSVPVEINVYAGKNRTPLPVRVLVNERELTPPYELPLDPQAEIVLALPGFRPALAGAADEARAGSGRIVIPRPFTRQQIYVVRKEARWRAALSFAPATCAFSADGRRIAAAGAGAYAILSAEDGRVLTQGRLPAADGAVTLAAAGEWFFCLSGGRVAAFGAGEETFARGFSPDGVQLRYLTAASDPDGSALALVGVGADVSGEGFWSGRAMQALRAPELRPVWKNMPETLQERPAAGPGLLAQGRLLYVDDAARLQVRPVDGDGVAGLAQPEEAISLQLPGVEGRTLAGRPALFELTAENGQERVLVLVPLAGRLAAMLLSAEKEVTPLWQAEGEYGDWMQRRGGTVWLLRAGREIEARALTDGTVLGRLARPDGVSGDPVFLPGRLFCCGPDGAGKGRLQAVRESAGAPGEPLWEYALPQTPAAVRTWHRGREARIACVSGRDLILLED